MALFGLIRVTLMRHKSFLLNDGLSIDNFFSNGINVV
ncbi:hypothetical protein EPIR_1363 [Erwinia piriflorinigrans CFBP 5888]|uniref:Uncharacterized protein n=1 Tax=Erwinia piriflorinigrans CFBP 5888 TaxID=1161919 RepID=V5Z626_9GAMM|nr:hypothetical protein EPIR_1363 [Erwinia piriflorinigrans CFBP 5888]